MRCPWETVSEGDMACGAKWTTVTRIEALTNHKREQSIGYGTS